MTPPSSPELSRPDATSFRPSDGEASLTTAPTADDTQAKALRESEDRFRAAILAVQGILWTNNAAGEMEGEQPGWSSITGQAYEDYQAFGWAKAVHPDDAQPTIDAWNEAVRERKPFLFEHRVRLVDGSWALFSIRAVPVLTSDGVIREWVGVHTNITESRAAKLALEASEQRYRTLSEHLDQQVIERTEELRLMVRDLERSNQSLEQFAYVASHDLQEPLRKIQSFGDMLTAQYGESLGNGVHLLQRMQTAAGRMSDLINDLLTFSLISTRQETAAPVPLDQVVRQVLIDLELAIGEAEATIELGPLPTIIGNVSQLGQLFQNLLNNALKFRRKKTDSYYVQPQIRLAVQSVPASELPPSVKPVRQTSSYHRIDVADNGIGFDPRYASRIFQVFQRLHSRDEFKGTGVGLAICQKVVANHGGAIAASSQPGQGATFHIYFPAHA